MVSVRFVHVVGARPQFVKLAPVCRAIAAANDRGRERIESIVVHTGQHYDASMSDVFFEELDLPHADIHLGVGSGSHGQQTARMLERLESALQEHRPDIVLTYGDTNSTLAATLAATKLQLAVAHIEAGLRSFNRQMPEETNRLVADHLSDLLFAPTPEAVRNLEREGLATRAVRVGDVMLDAIRSIESMAGSHSRILETLRLTPESYFVATVHRAESTNAEVLGRLLTAFNRLAREDRPVVFPVHPRTANCIRTELQGWRAAAGLRLVEPLGYPDMIRLISAARLVLTDSGGVQKEAFFLGRPCVTLRRETEWVETVSEGGNVIAGTEPETILDAVVGWEQRLAQGRLDFSGAVARVFGNGAAGEQVVSRTLEFLASRAAA